MGCKKKLLIVEEGRQIRVYSVLLIIKGGLKLTWLFL